MTQASFRQPLHPGGIPVKSGRHGRNVFGQRLHFVVADQTHDAFHGRALAIVACTALDVFHLLQCLGRVLTRNLRVHGRDGCFAVLAVTGKTGLGLV